jgi:hypothetical protein
VLLCSGPAQADGINLAWGDGCWADNPSTLRTFACDGNTNSFSMTASFSLTQDLTRFSALDAQLDLQSDAPGLPDWWQMCSAGGCRTGSLSGTADFNISPGGCTYAWPGVVPSALLIWRTFQWCSGNLVFSSPGRAQLFAHFQGPSAGTTIHHGAEYYAFRITVDGQKTTGADACGGCAIPATIVLNQIYLYGGILEPITTPLANTCLRWQAGGTTPCSATPVRNMTWGAIKSFYR